MEQERGDVRKESNPTNDGGPTIGAPIKDPIIKSVFKKFLNGIGEMSQAQKIKLIYTYFTKKKPDPNLSIDRILNRVLYEQEFGKKIKETEDVLKKTERQFKWKAKSKRIFKVSRKKANSNRVLVWYLNIKGEIEAPRLYPLYSGNMIIIRNKPYEVDPRAFWTMGKYKCMIFKQIDRRPVSNLNYTEIRRRGDATDSDEFLIKAAMKAIQGGGIKKPMSKGVIVVVLIILAIGVIYFMSS